MDRWFRLLWNYTHAGGGGGGGGSLGPQFISHAVGVPGNNNIPAALGTETSATWEGSAVGIRKADGTFLHGDARVVMPDFANSVIDVHLEGLRDISARTLDSNTFRWEDVDFNNSTGSFRSTTRSFFVEVRFYGEEQETVGGWFNHEEITGAFGGTRQPVP